MRLVLPVFVHAVVLLLILLLLMPLAQYIPMGCLAGVLVVVSYNMSGWRVFKALLKNPKSDVTVLLITFFLTVIFDLTVAIEVGLVIACVLFMRRVMETTEISVIKDEIGGIYLVAVQQFLVLERIYLPPCCRWIRLSARYIRCLPLRCCLCYLLCLPALSVSFHKSACHC